MKTSILLVGLGLAATTPFGGTALCRQGGAGNDPEALLAVCTNRTFGTIDHALLKQSFTYDGGGSVVSWRRNERADAASAWVRTANTYSTSFEITAIASRQGGDEVFVFGVEDSGEDVIEKWSFGVAAGQRIARAPSPIPALGTPLRPFAPTVLSVSREAAASWLRPTQGTLHPPERSSTGDRERVGSWTPQPTQRVDSSSLSPSPTRCCIASTSMQIPFRSSPSTRLRHCRTWCPPARCLSVSLGDHTSDGRVCMLTEFDDGVIPAQAAPEVTLIKDDDNDGVFDSAATMSHAAYVANAEYGDPSKWTPFWKLP